MSPRVFHIRMFRSFFLRHIRAESTWCNNINLIFSPSNDVFIVNMLELSFLFIRVCPSRNLSHDLFAGMNLISKLAKSQSGMRFRRQTNEREASNAYSSSSTTERNGTRDVINRQWNRMIECSLIAVGRIRKWDRPLVESSDWSWRWRTLESIPISGPKCECDAMEWG